VHSIQVQPAAHNNVVVSDISQTASGAPHECVHFCTYLSHLPFITRIGARNQL
jgi:hypothetical protein